MEKGKKNDGETTYEIVHNGRETAVGDGEGGLLNNEDSAWRHLVSLARRIRFLLNAIYLSCTIHLQTVGCLMRPTLCVHQGMYRGSLCRVLSFVLFSERAFWWEYFGASR